MSSEGRRKYAGSREYRQNRGPRKGSPHPAATPPNLATVEPVPLGRLTLGTVVWAHVDFVDEPLYKSRPVVVQARRGRTITVLPATTSECRHGLRDHVEILDLNAAGLHRPTGVRIRPITIDRIELISICGELSDDDLDRLAQATAHQGHGAPVAA